MSGETMNDIPLVDLAQMDRLKEWGGVGLQRKMIDLFLTHAELRLDQIREGVATGSPEKAETGAHTLKSSAGNVGAQRVQRLAQDVEALAEVGDMNELGALLPSLEDEFRAACDALRHFLDGVEE
jgi:HPt (histidine-containing phosphotransfer) domain-containing protein